MNPTCVRETDTDQPSAACVVVLLRVDLDDPYLGLRDTEARQQPRRTITPISRLIADNFHVSRNLGKDVVLTIDFDADFVYVLPGFFQGRICHGDEVKFSSVLATLKTETLVATEATDIGDLERRLSTNHNLLGHRLAR